MGDLQMINSWFAYYLPPEDKNNFRLNPNLAGGSLLDVGVYPHRLVIVMAQAGAPGETGAPVEVWASQAKGETGVEGYLVGQRKFANGVVAQISSGFRSPFREGAHIIGTKGSVQISEPWKPHQFGQGSQILFSGRDGAEETIQIPHSDPYLHEVQAMEACVLDGAKPLVPLSLSRDFLKSVLALYRSAESGQPVTL